VGFLPFFTLVFIWNRPLDIKKGIKVVYILETVFLDVICILLQVSPKIMTPDGEHSLCFTTARGISKCLTEESNGTRTQN